MDIDNDWGKLETALESSNDEHNKLISQLDRLTPEQIKTVILKQHQLLEHFQKLCLLNSTRIVLSDGTDVNATKYTSLWKELEQTLKEIVSSNKI